MQRIINYLLAFLMALFLVSFIFVVSTWAQPYLSAPLWWKGRAVQLWTLWATDEAGMPMRPLLRFTSFDACYAAGLRHGFTMGETADCLMYRIGDFEK